MAGKGGSIRESASARPATVGAVPKSLRAEWKLDRFYTKYADAGGLPVLASRRVDDRALAVAASIVIGMTSRRPEIRAAMAPFRIRVSVIGKTEETTDIPEYAKLREQGMYWNHRARGLGATQESPAISAGEENLLRMIADRYFGMSVLVHEFAHAVHEFGLAKLDPKFEPRLYKTYMAAMGKGLWANTYAAANWNEYWAEGVQSYFDANSPRWLTDGIHNGIATRKSLKKYDPALYELIDHSLKSPKWSWLERLPTATHLVRS